MKESRHLAHRDDEAAQDFEGSRNTGVDLACQTLDLSSTPDLITDVRESS